jgi:hypothetical protein
VLAVYWQESREEEFPHGLVRGTSRVNRPNRPLASGVETSATCPRVARSNGRAALLRSEWGGCSVVLTEGEMMARATRKQIAREFLHDVVKNIQAWGSDHWPDHLWPQAAEVCDEISKRLAEEHSDSLLVSAIEHRLCDEGMLLWQVYEGSSPLHRAYQSLFDLYCETERENEKLRKQLGIEPDHMMEENREKIYGAD